MSKDPKILLKEAKALLKAGNYSEALKKSQKVLKEDKNNYSALLLIAGSMKGIEEYKSQVHLPLKKAIKVQPENSTAYNGLVAYYEKEPDKRETWIELLPLYCQLIKIDEASPKVGHYITEISRLVMNLKDTTYTATAIDALVSIRKQVNEHNCQLAIDETLSNIFIEFPDICQQFSDVYQLVLSAAVENESYNRHHEYFRYYLKFLFSLEQYDRLMSAATKMHHIYPSDLIPLEWICRIYSEQKVINDTNIDGSIPIDYFYNHLLQLDTASYLGIIAKAIHLWQQNNLIDARDFLNQAVSINPQQFCAWVALCQLNKTLYCWPDAEAAAIEALKYIDKKKFSNLEEKLKIILIESMIKSANRNDSYEKAIDMWTQLELDEIEKRQANNNIKLWLARAKILRNDPDALEFLNEIEKNLESECESSRAEIVFLRTLRLKLEERFEEAIDVIESALESSEAWFILGQMNWQLCNYNHALIAFLKGVHADPNNWQCLVYLGHYYREQGNDLEKCRKCYQKALRINPHSDEAGAGLSTAYRLLKNSQANLEMLQRVTTSEGGGPKWAWLQLGLQQLDEGDITQAIKSLRYVIRADPNDNHCWESLADAYWSRGAHTSALKSYQRALELCPGSLYPMIQLANINLVLGRHLEAKQAFTQVLTQQDKYLPALKGMAETCLGLAREHSKAQLLTRALENIQQAADYITEAIIENPNLSCLWKLLGDACYRAATLPPTYCSLFVVRGLIKESADQSTDSKIKIQRSQLFMLSSRSYCRALSISNDSPFLWHDLACCYFSQFRIDPTVDKNATVEKCLIAAKQAVQLNPASWVHWNLLGVICMTEDIKNYALAQHCWVMAIDREPNNAIAWTNLGILYLHLDEHYKANDAFSRAQRADPDYGNSWIGQALIAEMVHNKEAMDLFRHAVQLAYHSEAALGYAHLVLTTILDPNAKKYPLYTYSIVNMHAVPVAIDIMNWYVDREPDSLYGRNALGLLLERQKLLKSAAIQFSEAVKLSLTSSSYHQDITCVNYARVLVQLGNYEQAIELCKRIARPSFQSHCQLALALFKAQKYEESYEAYGAALQWLADAPSDEAHVLCAMAAMAYMFQGVDQVKTLLYQCIQIQPPIVAGLLAAAALGLLHNDYNLTGLVLNELQVYKDHPNYRHHVAILSAYSSLINEDDLPGAVRIISKAVHRHPDDVPSWLGLVRILLETDYTHFGNCAQRALFLGRRSATVAVAQVACISSLGQLVDSHGNDDGLRSIQKTLHSFPGHVGSWANVIVALSSSSRKNYYRPNTSWLLSLIDIVSKKFTCTPAMNQWLTTNYKALSKIAIQ